MANRKMMVFSPEVPNHTEVLLDDLSTSGSDSCSWGSEVVLGIEQASCCARVQ